MFELMPNLNVFIVSFLFMAGGIYEILNSYESIIRKFKFKGYEDEAYDDLLLKKEEVNRKNLKKEKDFLAKVYRVIGTILFILGLSILISEIISI